LPLFIVTTPLLTEQTEPGVALMVGVTPSLVVLATGKVDRYTALPGAPVKVTLGAIFVAVVLSVAVAAEYTSLAGTLAVTEQRPVPLVMVTVVPLALHEPVAVMVGTSPEVEVAAAEKLD
jgi:hypothetical protein